MNKEKSLKTSIWILFLCILMSILIAGMAYYNVATEYLNNMSMNHGINILLSIGLICGLGIMYYSYRLDQFIKMVKRNE